MGIAYHANYFRWFEIGRSEMFRSLGLAYREIEKRGYFLPISEVGCKFLAPVRYDDLLVIETTLDTTFRGGMKFVYRILKQADGTALAKGFTRHAFLDKKRQSGPPPRICDGSGTGDARPLSRLDGPGGMQQGLFGF